MRAVVQRCARASVRVEDKTVGQIGGGLMVLLGVETDDGERDAAYIADKIANLRIFEDSEGKLNLSVTEVGGSVLLVSQFTLYGDARNGRRPSFIQAAKGENALELFNSVRRQLERGGLKVETGEFGAHMQVELVNDGPVTILLCSKKTF